MPRLKDKEMQLVQLNPMSEPFTSRITKVFMSKDWVTRGVVEGTDDKVVLDKHSNVWRQPA